MLCDRHIVAGCNPSFYLRWLDAIKINLAALGYIYIYTAVKIDGAKKK
jgi:hypothetical protein